MKRSPLNYLISGLLVFCLGIYPFIASGQTNESLVLQVDQKKQSVVGFGASLAYYENWLNAHPNKSEIYEAIFGELSLDILRVRNAFDYDPGMVDRVKEYMVAAEASLGYPIKLLSSSWGPTDALKNTGDRKNGGTLRYSIDEGVVKFDYGGFAQWWNSSLDEYEAQGILPDYISIQNEPAWSASWETCLFNPNETISATDTIAGYNRALDAVYDSLQTREQRPLILGPEPAGIGFNSVENYVNALDLSKLDGIAHHLYHGVDENDPYASSNFSKVGDFHPEVPHIQTEYSLGDWFSLAGLIYKSFYDEQVVAYLYWDLIWNEGGLVQLDFPWDQSQWIDPQKGYTKTKDFYAFKQFSAFIHPGWLMTDHTLTGSENASLTFISPTGDSAVCVVINRSDTKDLKVHMEIPGYRIAESAVYSTSEDLNCELVGTLVDSLLTLSPHSIATVDMRILEYDPATDTLAPTIPGGLQIIDVSDQSLSVTWDPSMDSVGVKGYRIYVDGLLTGTTIDTSYVISELEPNTSYEVAVSAFDQAGNESEKSNSVTGTTLFFDHEPPRLEATDSIYQEGIIEVISSEDGVVFLVPADTPGEISSIRKVSMDSIEVMAGTAASLLISGMDNGVYWLYASDSAENISEPQVLTILGVGIESSIIQTFSAFPNPFSKQLVFRFTLHADQEISLVLMDSQGRVVRKEIFGPLAAGQNQVILQRDKLPEGIYFFRLEDSEGEGRSGPLMIQD